MNNLSSSEKERKILRYIYSYKHISRNKLNECTNYTKPTVYRIIDDLIDGGKAIISGISDDGIKGRPTEIIAANPDSGYVFCVNIDRMYFSTAIVDLANEIRCKEMTYFEGRMEPDFLVKKAYEQYKGFLEKYDIDDTKVLGVSLSLVGPLDYANGSMIGPLYFKGGEWVCVPVKKMFEDTFNIKVLFDCKANACLLGHYLPTYIDKYSNVAYITINEVIGSGLVLNYRLHNRENVIEDGLAHMVIDINGRKCTCGRYGCVEAYSSGEAIKQRCMYYLKLGRKSILQNNMENLTLTSIRKALENNDPLAEEVIWESSRIFAQCLDNYLKIVDLDAIIIGGRLIEDIPQTFDEINNHIDHNHRVEVDIIKGMNENDNVLRGIASKFILSLL